jgi:hypothetical protein
MINRLWAIAYERHANGQVYTRIEYSHAKNEIHARVQFFRQFKLRELRQIKLVGIAPVVGYHVHDDHGEKLSVD